MFVEKVGSLTYGANQVRRRGSGNVSVKQKKGRRGKAKTSVSDWSCLLTGTGTANGRGVEQKLF